MAGAETSHPGVVAQGSANTTKPTVSAGAAASNGTKIGGAPSSTAPSSGYYVSVKADVPETSIPLYRTDGERGYVDSSGQFSGTAKALANSSDSYYVAIPTGACSVSADGEPTATATGGTAEVSVEGMKTTVTNTGYKLHANATGGTAKATTPTISDTHTAGYIPSKAKTTVIAAKDTNTVAGTSQNIDKYVVAATIRTTETSGETYSETRDNGSELIIPSGGALYINEGYIKNTKITLDEMLGGKEDTAAIDDKKVAAGHIVYDVDGVKHVGNMKDSTCTFSGGTTSATATAGTASVSIDNSAAVNAGISATPTNYYISADASATGGSASASITDVTHTRTEGYATATNGANAVAGSSKEAVGQNATENKKVYLKEATASGRKGDTAAAKKPAVTVSHTVNRIKTTSENTGYSCTTNATTTSVGEYTLHIDKTAGYLTEGSQSFNFAGDAPTITNDNNSLYFKTTGVTTGESVSLGGGSTEGYHAPIPVSFSSSNPQLVMTASAEAEEGCVVSNPPSSTAKYIDYYTGAYLIESNEEN